jgi:hypothetical protein
LALAAFGDHSAPQQRRDDIALIFIEQARDIRHSESVIEEEVANCNGSFGPGIEIRAVAGHNKLTLTHLEAISSFMVGLFHLDTFEERPEFHGNQKKRGLPFYRQIELGTLMIHFRLSVKLCRRFSTVDEAQARKIKNKD